MATATKYNVGDKVKVRADLAKHFPATSVMEEEFGGKVVTISAKPAVTVFGEIEGYNIEEDKNPDPFKRIFTDNMFEGLATETPAVPETPKATEVKPTEVNPMPKLTTGMFGVHADGDPFVVVNDILVFLSGKWGTVDFYQNCPKFIKALYKAHCFNTIKEGNGVLIWENPNPHTPEDDYEDEEL